MFLTKQGVNEALHPSLMRNSLLWEPSVMPLLPQRMNHLCLLIRCRVTLWASQAHILEVLHAHLQPPPSAHPYNHTPQRLPRTPLILREPPSDPHFV